MAIEDVILAPPPSVAASVTFILQVEWLDRFGDQSYVPQSFRQCIFVTFCAGTCLIPYENTCCSWSFIVSYRYKQRSKWAILFILASLSFSLSIVYPSLPQVLVAFDASMSSLGHAIALPFVMELISMPLYSCWYNFRSIKEPVIAGLGLSAIGSIVYANAESSTMIILAR